MFAPINKRKQALKDNVVFESRKPNPEIIEYLNDALDSLEPLSYHIEGFFDISELCEVLNEDIPSGFFASGRRQFIDDMTNLCDIFFKMTESKNILFQLEIVKADMCRLFHVDNMRQRLLCTYTGLGTEWLEHSNVYRDGLGKGSNNKIVKDFKKIKKAKPFEVLILKGAKCGGREFAVVHRSPPVEKGFKTRVLLKIDEYQGG